MKSIDIYSETKITNWAQLKADGIEAVYIKVTQGKTYQNPIADSQYKSAKQWGFLIGMYHFGGDEFSAKEEYANYLNVIKKYKLDFKPCLDYEVARPNYAFIKSFMSFDSTMIYYGSHSTADHTGLPLNRIWIAEPNTSPCNTRGYAGIQFTWTGKLAGLIGNADEDIFTNNVLKAGVTLSKSAIKPVFTGSVTIRTLQQAINLQFKKHLVCDGVIGPLTIAELPLTKFGSKGAFVKAIQQLLKLPVTSIFDTNTIKGVKAFQAKVKNPSLTIDGVVGEKTWQRLL